MSGRTPQVRIVEESWLARIARWRLRSGNVAMTLGDSIHLSGVTKEKFLRNEAWVRHELVHVEQFRRYGFWTFLVLYFVEWLRHGYENNRFELEANERTRTFRRS